MDTVGIRELKTHLSRHMKRVRAGARIQVTERGRTIATLSPVDAPHEGVEVEWARKPIQSGRAQWSGGKPRGSLGPAKSMSRPTVAEAVLEDRR